MIDWKVLIERASQAQSNAYARYSNFSVGAAILGQNGEIFAGCNVENSSYGLTNCAERTAVFSAVSEGVKDFRALVVISDSKSPAKPCGACRQVLYEFSPQLEILCINNAGQRENFLLSDLFPEGFKL